MSKIKLDVIKPWIQDKLTEILKIDDDVVVDFVYNQLEEKVSASQLRIIRQISLEAPWTVTFVAANVIFDFQLTR